MMTASASTDAATSALADQQLDANVSVVGIEGSDGFASDGLNIILEGPASEEQAAVAAVKTQDAVNSVVYRPTDAIGGEQNPASPTATTASSAPSSDDTPATTTGEKALAPETSKKEPPSSENPPASGNAIDETLNKLFELEPIEFTKNRSNIRNNSFATLDKAATILAENPQVGSLVVVGHTDTDGAASINAALSQARAEAVVAYLVEQKGIDASRLTADGKGETQPLVTPELSSADKQKNRRIAWERG